MPKSHQSWDRSQHPPTQWNQRGGRWSNVEYSTWKKIQQNPPVILWWSWLFWPMFKLREMLGIVVCYGIKSLNIWPLFNLFKAHLHLFYSIISPKKPESNPDPQSEPYKRIWEDSGPKRRLLGCPDHIWIQILFLTWFTRQTHIAGKKHPSFSNVATTNTGITIIKDLTLHFTAKVTTTDLNMENKHP